MLKSSAIAFIQLNQTLIRQASPTGRWQSIALAVDRRYPEASLPELCYRPAFGLIIEWLGFPIIGFHFAEFDSTGSVTRS